MKHRSTPREDKRMQQQASQPIPLQNRFAEREPRLHISAIVEQDPTTNFDSVGLQLQAHRARKGHELEMASRVLRIRETHLKAIEDDHYEALPGRTYAVGFVRAYAEYLGLDPEDCVRRFKLEYAAVMEPKVDGKEKPSKGNMAFPDLREEVKLPTGSFIVLTGLLVLAVWGGWYLSTADERAFSDQNADAAITDTSVSDAVLTEPDVLPPAPETAIAADALVPAAENAAQENPETATVIEAAEDAIVVDAEPTAAVDIPATEPEATPTEINVPEPVPAPTHEAEIFGAQNHDARVILRARGNSWIRVEDLDGTVLIEQVLAFGDSYRVPNRNGIIMATRNAGALEIIVDGASLGPAGNVGQALLALPLDANVRLSAASR